MTRRELLLKYPACGSVALVQLASYKPSGTPVMNAAEFHASRRLVQTRFGRIAYVERGEGQAALFLHGLPLNGYFWRGALARLSAHRRCIAPDFMGLGYTVTDLAQTLSPSAQADMIAAFLDALSIGTADVVANDSGGAIAQLLATRYPTRVRTLLLTNCDVHTNCPPAVLAPVVAAACQGRYDEEFARNRSDKAFARSAKGLGGRCWADPATLTDESIECYFAPLLSSTKRKTQFNHYICEFEPNPLPAIEAALKRCTVPTRMVWGMADHLFDVSWAEWLDRTLPRSRGVRRVEGAKLFFPEERPELIAEEAVTLWASGPA